ncbi:MAG: flagellar biosynthetic protein FliR [Verrucomicrobiota bacterium]
MELVNYNWMLVFMRLSAFLYVLPFFSTINFPHMMRIALGALAAMLIAPLLPPFPLAQLKFFSLIGVMFQEVSVGLLLGFLARMIFYAVELAGNIISTEMGLNLASVMNPAEGQTVQAPGMMLFFLATIVMLTLDLHHWILMGFERTYLVLPIGGAHLNSALFEAIVAQTARIFMVALQISAPMIAVSFVVTMIFAVLSRAVPQMNVFAESFGFRIAAGLIVFGFTLQLTAIHVMNHLRRLPDDLLVIAQMIGGGRL